MSVISGPNIVTNGLVLHLDAANTKSYSGSGTTWTDLSGNGNNGTLTNGPTFDSANYGSVVHDGVDDYIVGNTPVTGNTNATMTGFVKITLNKKGAFFKNSDGSGGYSIGIGSGTFDSIGNKIIMLFPCVRWMGSQYDWNSGWQLVTMTIDSSGVPRAYKNDQFIFAGTASSNSAYSLYYLEKM